MTPSQVSKSDNLAKDLLNEALAYHNAENLGEAERCYLAVLEMEKDNAKALTFLGALHVQRREYRKATRVLRRSLRIDDRQPNALNSLGNALRESMRYEDAVASYDRAIALRADFSGAHFNKALALQMAGSLDDALASYDRAIALKPDYVEALNNRANVLVKLQHYDRALEDFAHAIRLKPDSAQIHNNRGTALRALRRYSAALESYNQAIALHSNYAEAHSNRGLALYSLGDHSEALASYDRAIALGADNADVHFGRGDVLRAVKRYADAVKSYDRAIELRADFAEAHLNKGLALEKDRRWAEALASYNQAIALKPDSALAHSNAGSVLGSLWRHDEALASFERAIALKPDFAEAYNNRAIALNRLNRREESLADFDKAIAAKPDLVAAHYSRANLLRDVQRFEEALKGYDKAVALDPNCAEAHHDRAIALMVWGRLADAQDGFERALECDPELPYTLGFRWGTKLAVCDWNGLQQDRDALRTAVGLGSKACPPFAFMTVPCTPDLLRKCSEIYVNGGFRPQPPDALGPPLCRKPRADGRIRLAYVSADLRTHAVALLIAGIFEQHDKDKFELYAISLGRDDGSKLRVRMKSAFEHFIDVTEKNDYEVAALLRNEQIDIAVDLTGFTKDSRPGILAFRPAPVQVNYLGYPGTLGADYIDYIIADKIVIPEDEQSHYTEKVVYLPDTYQCNDSKRQAGPMPSRGAVGLPTEAFVFCSFNNTYKIMPEIFDIWMRLLRQKEGSILWLLQSNATAAQNLRREAEVRGVAPERLVFAPPVPNPEHLARHQLADLFLDTLPYGAHTTASDALWMGLPVLTCRGENFQGRVAASLLSAVGLPEMVTHSFEEYEARALELAGNPEALAGIRAKLLRNRDTHALFDTVRFARYLEAAYARMVERYRNGEPPISFAVEPI